MPELSMIELEQLLREGAVKLEITGGIPTWEALPGLRHQRMVDRIRASISPDPTTQEGCDCAHYADVTIRFADGSFKRPDISIFCADPEEDVDEALTQIPEAIVEIISVGYEYKDLELNPPFYLSHGVIDVIIVDPRTGTVSHYTTSGVSNHQVPVTVRLQCGCVCTVPAPRRPAAEKES